MKRKTIVVGGRELTIDAYDTPLDVRVGQTVADLNREIAQEEELYDRLGELAKQAALLLRDISTETRAAAYWKIGSLINRQLEQVRSPTEPRDTKPFQKRERIEETLLQQLSERLRAAGVEKSEYSKPYLRKMARLASIMGEDQVRRPLPYPFFHELLNDELSRPEIDSFLDRCESGEFGSSDNMKLRAAVNQLLLEKQLARLSGSETLKRELIDRAGRGENLRRLRRELAERTRSSSAA